MATAVSTIITNGALTAQVALPTEWSLADLQEHLGGIPAERIRLFPPPGYATEEDVIQAAEREGRLCELEDGILVEKPMGWYESWLGVLISMKLAAFVTRRKLGKVLGADGTIRILPGKVKIPDVCFISWKRWPRKRLPRRPIPALVPDLVVEVLSQSNTRREMKSKLHRYFEAGVRLVWYVDPASRAADAYTSPTEVTHIEPAGELDGGEVLPGFRLSLPALFEEADYQPEAEDLDQDSD
jgi:Uma2 family endonuclease